MRKRGRRNAIVRSAFVLIFIVLIASVINMQYELRDLRDKRTLLQEKVQDVQDNIQEMQMRLDTP
ncbi:MAG TPA: hypothetical protein DCP51_05505, partial [Clostridiales bacterium]|nr:hypothetical protein [Clostridiales bacterium]